MGDQAVEVADPGGWPVGVPLPEYRSAAWYGLDVSDRARALATIRAADAWHALTSSPHVAELLIAEWVEWDRRRVDRETSRAVSAAGNRSDAYGRPAPSAWRLAAGAPTYAELARRRAERGCPVRCPRCHIVRTVWPVPSSAVCDRCRHLATARPAA